MHVHEAGSDHQPGGVYHGAAFGRVYARCDGLDHAALDKDVRYGVHVLARVYDPAALYECGLHKVNFLAWA